MTIQLIKAKGGKSFFSLLIALLFLFFWTTLSCSRKNEKAANSNVKKSEFYSTLNFKSELSEFNISTYLTSSPEIYLAFQPGQFIGRVGGMFEIPDGFGVWDATDYSIFLFNHEGDMLRKINGFGPGPEEYEFMSKVIWNSSKDLIEVLDPSKNRVISYSILGDFVRVNDVGGLYRFKDFEAIGDKYIFQLASTLDEAEILITNDKFKPIASHLKDKDLYAYLPTPFNMLSNNGDGRVFFHLAFRNEIYTYDGKQLTHLYDLDFGAIELPANYFGELDKSKGGEIMFKLNELRTKRIIQNYFPILTAGDVMVLKLALKEGFIHLFINLKTGDFNFTDSLAKQNLDFGFSTGGVLYNFINKDDGRIVLQKFFPKNINQ